VIYYIAAINILLRILSLGWCHA